MSVRILFYGDSNTWGYIRGGERLSPRHRFPLLACSAIPGAQAIEDGMNGRNCAFAHPLVAPEYLGGATFQAQCRAALPIDALCLMLGTNDQLPPLYRTKEDIAQDLQKIIRLARHLAPEARILLVNPVPIHPEWAEEYSAEMGACQAPRLEPLADALAAIALAEGVAYFDPTPLIPAADAGDGVHLSAKSHEILGTAIGHELATLLAS